MNKIIKTLAINIFILVLLSSCLLPQLIIRPTETVTPTLTLTPSPSITPTSTIEITATPTPTPTSTPVPLSKESENSTYYISFLLVNVLNLDMTAGADGNGKGVDEMGIFTNYADLAAHLVNYQGFTEDIYTDLEDVNHEEIKIGDIVIFTDSMNPNVSPHVAMVLEISDEEIILTGMSAPRLNGSYTEAAYSASWTAFFPSIYQTMHVYHSYLPTDIMIPVTEAAYCSTTYVSYILIERMWMDLSAGTDGNGRGVNKELGYITHYADLAAHLVNYQGFDKYVYTDLDEVDFDNIKPGDIVIFTDSTNPDISPYTSIVTDITDDLVTVAGYCAPESNGTFNEDLGIDSWTRFFPSIYQTINVFHYPYIYFSGSLQFPEVTEISEADTASSIPVSAESRYSAAYVSYTLKARGMILSAGTDGYGHGYDKELRLITHYEDLAIHLVNYQDYTAYTYTHSQEIDFDKVETGDVIIYSDPVVPYIFPHVAFVTGEHADKIYIEGIYGPLKTGTYIEDPYSEYWTKFFPSIFQTMTVYHYEGDN